MSFGKTSFRLLDKAEESDGAPRSDFPLVQNEQPLSMASITAAIYEVFDRRFASTLWNSISAEFFDWLEPEHINYNRVLGWMLIKDNPALARELIYGFFLDYEAGLLTVAGLPEPIEGTAELDENGEEVAGTEELSELVYVKPGTSTVVNLTGVNSKLNGKIYKLNNYYEDEIPQIRPAALLSQNEADTGVSYPAIRTQTPDFQTDEYPENFGSPNKGSGVASDLRLINCMYGTRITVRTGGVTTTRNQYLGTKIVAAEVIDATLDVLRALVLPFAEVPNAGDGDPVFPFVPQMKSPYGTSNGLWGYSGAGYESFQMPAWLSTVEEFEKLFVRKGSETTYFRRQEWRKIAYKVVDVFSWMMQQYDFLSLESETLTSENTSIVAPPSAYPNPEGVYLESKSYGPNAAGEYRLEFFRPLSVCIKFDSSSGKVSRLGEPNTSDVSSSSRIREHVEILSGIINDLLEIPSFSEFDEGETDIRQDLPTFAAGHRRKGGELLSSYADLLQSAHREDVMLAFQHDFLEKYATRVDSYKQAAIDLVEGEGSPLAEFVTTVRSLGDAGTDILQNLSVNQLALKQVALEEEKGDPRKAYLPNVSVISRAEINAVKGLCKQNILKSPEGNTTRVMMVGIPLNTFDQHNIESRFCLRVSYRDIEYPQLVFRSKSYQFDKDFYVLPEDLDSIRSTSSFNSMFEAAKFSKIRVEVQESKDTSASIQIVDDIKKMTGRQLSAVTSNPNSLAPFKNLLVSEIIKLYYRIMLGVSFSEVTYLSTSEELVIPISKSSATLANSMAANVDQLSQLSETLGTNVQGILDSVTSFANIDSFVEGDLQPVDAALLKDLRNAYQTRLFSPELLRNRTLAAKMFDRIYAIPVDPDEFYVVPPGQSQFGGDSTSTSMRENETISTPSEIFDYYLNAGIIERTELPAPFEYKLAPRKTAEGSMALGSVTVSMTTIDDEQEVILGL